jgi:hypothetical protein
MAIVVLAFVGYENIYKERNNLKQVNFQKINSDHWPKLKILNLSTKNLIKTNAVYRIKL